MTHGFLQQTLSKTHDGWGTILTHLTYFQHGWSHIEHVECTNSAPLPHPPKLTHGVWKDPICEEGRDVKGVPCGPFALATCELLGRFGERSHITCYIGLNC